MTDRRTFLGGLAAIPVAGAGIEGRLLPRVRIAVGPEPQPYGKDITVWLDGVEITRDIPIRNERRFRRAKPGDTLTFTKYSRNAAGDRYAEGGRLAKDVVRALVVA